ncbi:hypothetical protein E2P81_ATG11021 [Venturia nashicola]|uniref:Lytic polysaccharide monooxygenase n=1 Tax=Venturia nashicola TaxID=86259 RepID=A0A4Z1NX77_9PEZI|nr:hypothetical protein E6O75_ATG10697 [Venturia nashicola]TLD27733.1 hypothetical protein E2P81_ATG11021 [Venturia nashicola]
MSPLLKAIALTLTAITQAHMQLHSPASLNASNNPHTTGPPDNRLHYPHNCCGRKTEYPCRGYLNLLGTPAGAPTVTWAPGSRQSWSMAGPAPLGGTHYGGSCQIGLSLDKGKTFRTITSYEGNCPHRNGSEDSAGQMFNFTVPNDLPVGEAVFAWTWFNREQEFNMNCAAVLISGGNSTSKVGGGYSAMMETSLDRVNATAALTRTIIVTETEGECGSSAAQLICSTPSTYSPTTSPPTSMPSSVAFNDRPKMLIVDIANGCLPPKTIAELKFPEPGVDVEEGDGMYPLSLPVGDCSVALW